MAAAAGAVALLTMMTVSRAAGATLAAQLSRGFAAGVLFAVAVLAAVTVVRWLGDADADTPADETGDIRVEAEAAAQAAAAAVQAEPADDPASDGAAALPAAVSPAGGANTGDDEFAPLVVPRLSAAEVGATAGSRPEAGVSDD